MLLESYTCTESSIVAECISWQRFLIGRRKIALSGDGVEECLITQMDMSFA